MSEIYNHRCICIKYATNCYRELCLWVTSQLPLLAVAAHWCPWNTLRAALRPHAYVCPEPAALVLFKLWIALVSRFLDNGWAWVTAALHISNSACTLCCFHCRLQGILPILNPSPAGVMYLPCHITAILPNSVSSISIPVSPVPLFYLWEIHLCV